MSIRATAKFQRRANTRPMSHRTVIVPRLRSKFFKIKKEEKKLFYSTIVLKNKNMKYSQLEYLEKEL